MAPCLARPSLSLPLAVSRRKTSSAYLRTHWCQFTAFFSDKTVLRVILADELCRSVSCASSRTSVHLDILRVTKPRRTVSDYPACTTLSDLLIFKRVIFSFFFFLLLLLSLLWLEPKSVQFLLEQSCIWKALPKITKNPHEGKEERKVLMTKTRKCCPICGKNVDRKKKTPSISFAATWMKDDQTTGFSSHGVGILSLPQTTTLWNLLFPKGFFFFFFCQQPQQKTFFSVFFFFRFLHFTSITSPAGKFARRPFFSSVHESNV